MKAAAVSDRLRAGAQEVLVHTGQHYDDDLSQVFFDELGLPRPEHQLDLGGGTQLGADGAHARRSAAADRERAPDAVLVYGDTNSTLAGALAGAQAGVPVAHVEAGMRSYDRTMPEELNRVLADHAAALLLCSSERSAETLRGERVVGEVVVVGDVMVDVAQLLAPRARERTQALDACGVAPGGYLLATAHRAGNVDDPARLRAARGAAARRRRAARAPAAPAHAARDSRPPACSSALPRACGSPRRSATWISWRCCCTRAGCSPTPVASRRRRTWRACRA